MKLIFLVVSRAASLLGLIRGRPGRTGHGALLAGTLPAERLAAVRLIFTPGTILRWHRDIMRLYD